MTEYEFDDAVDQLLAILGDREYSNIHDGWAAWSYYATQGEWL